MHQPRGLVALRRGARLPECDTISFGSWYQLVILSIGGARLRTGICSRRIRHPMMKGSPLEYRIAGPVPNFQNDACKAAGIGDHIWIMREPLEAAREWQPTLEHPLQTRQNGNGPPGRMNRHNGGSLDVLAASFISRARYKERHLNSKQRRAAQHAARRAGIDITKAMSPPNTQIERTTKQSSLRRRFRKSRRRAWAIVVMLATFGSILGFYILRPDVLIEPYASLDPSRPFAQQFSVQNASNYPIIDVAPLCFFGQDSGMFIKNMSLAQADEIVKSLEPGAKTTLTCRIDTGPMQQELNIVPWVEYTIPFGIRRCKAVNFRGKPAVGGTYIWTYHGSRTCFSN